MNSLRPHAAAAERPSVPVSPIRRASVRTAIALGVLALGAMLPLPAHASSGGRIGNASPPSLKADEGSLTYDTFTTSSCSQNGFSTNAIGHLSLTGQVNVAGNSLLDGVPYDAFSANLELGPADFDTAFFRPRDGDPPFGATSASYTFVFDAVVFNEGVPVGRTVTTVVCSNGAFSASSQWVPGSSSIPAGHPASWVLLALFLAVTAASRLAARRP